MRLTDCYRLLDLDPSASFEEVRRSHRDLTKVWHPDRFGQDAPLRQKAEEKLKAINEAFATIRDAHDRRGTEDNHTGDGQFGWKVRSRGRELRLRDLDSVARLAARGELGADAELFDRETGQWVPLSTVPQLRTALALARNRRNRGWAMTLGGLALFILFRRPTPGGLLIALVLGATALILFSLERTRD